MKLVGDLVRDRRERLALTMDEACNLAGVSPHTWVRAEHNGEIRPSSARRIADALGVEPEDLMGEPVLGKADAAAAKARQAAADARQRARDFRESGGEARFRRAVAKHEGAVEEAKRSHDSTQAQLYAYMAGAVLGEAVDVQLALTNAFFESASNSELHEELRAELAEFEQLTANMRKTFEDLGFQPVEDVEIDSLAPGEPA